MKKITYIVLLVLSTLAAFSQAPGSMSGVINTPPKPAKLVNDYANILTPDQLQALEAKLVRFDDTTSSQVTVVIVTSLDGMEPTDAATELGRSWGVGGKQNSNGVILLISRDDRKLSIAPGYGLEKSLPDITTQQIIQNIIVPNFKGNDYYSGIDEGTDAIILAIKGEYKAPANYRSRGGGGGIGKIIVIIIIIIVILALSGGGGGGGFMSRRGYRGFGGPVFFPGSGGGFGGGFGGGGSSGGGGGFGGFGGGGFGGGGSSGSW